MSEREQHMDTDKRTGTSGQCGNTDEMRWDLGTLFPAKGDPRRPPEWLGRALLYIAIAIVLLSFCWRSWGKIEYLIIDVVISLFLALAVEPVVIPLVKHGWKRSFASIFALLMLGVLLCVMFGLFGNLFVQQVIALCNGLPALYQQICDFVAQYTDFKLPEINSLGGEILKNIQTSWVTDFAGTAISTVSGFFSFLLNLMTVIMTTFYISAAGPKLRRAACQWMAPSAQRRFLFVWTVSQTQISSFLFSRAILAVLNAFFTSICLMALHVPYWMPLALFCGVVSQFIPMLGTYIGGALPVLFAWGSCGLWQAIAVVAFICVYQQIENLIFAPQISRFRTRSRSWWKAPKSSASTCTPCRAPCRGRARMCRFPTTCASCRSRRTISLGPTRPGMPTNRRPSPFRSTCWTGSIASRCGEPRKRTERRRKPDRR